MLEQFLLFLATPLGAVIVGAFAGIIAASMLFMFVYGYEKNQQIKIEELKKRR